MSDNNQQNPPLPKALQKLSAINHNKKIKLRCKKTKDKGYSLYLDLWFRGRRNYEFLELYVVGHPSTKNSDKEMLRLAQAIRDEKENALLRERTGFDLTGSKGKASFIQYFREVAVEKKHQNWNSALKHIIDFAGERVTFSHVDKNFSEKFRAYLLARLDVNTSQTYFGKFKTALNLAVKRDIIQDNPAKMINIQRRESTREFLTLDELKRLADTPSADREVRNAFLFSCWTGLRISDIRKLLFRQVNEGYIDFRQQKTKGIERIKLHGNALDIIEEQRELRKKSENGLIFLLPLDSGTLSKVIRNWIAAAEIEKKITFHSARHTFATMCLTFDVDIYTVSKLLGHKNLKTTQIYAKLIDKKKDEAIDKLPNI